MPRFAKLDDVEIRVIYRGVSIVVALKRLLLRLLLLLHAECLALVVGPEQLETPGSVSHLLVVGMRCDPHHTSAGETAKVLVLELL